MSSVSQIRLGAARPRLFERREKVSLTVDQVAAATGLAVEALKDCESGRLRDPDTVKKFDRFLRKHERPTAL